MKRHHSGLTLIEVLLSVTILALILALIVPQVLRYTHNQAVDKTVAEMNQIVLSARNYYLDKQGSMTSTLSNASYWPQTLSNLSTNAYLPPAALCSSWPLTTTIAGNTCGNHQPYIVFPSTNPSSTAGSYDTSVVGIASGTYGKGGNFWGVSINLPNATIAEEVRQKLPFATRCSVAKLKSGNACVVADEGATVTALVPRPAIFMTSNYSREGLIQTMGSIKVCNNADPNYGQRYPPNGNNTSKPSCDSMSDHGGNDHNVVHIPMPSSCDVGQKPVLFVYPFDFYWDRTRPDLKGREFPGITLKTTRDDTLQLWSVTATESGQYAASQGSLYFQNIYLAYFTTCAPANDPNKWDPSSFPGA